MIELELQGEYVMDFFCRRSDGLGFREVKNNAVTPDLFIPADLRRIHAPHGTICCDVVNMEVMSRNYFVI